MAEARGLFGRTDGPPKKPTQAQSARVKATLAALRPQSDSMDAKKGHKVKVNYFL